MLVEILFEYLIYFVKIGNKYFKSMHFFRYKILKKLTFSR